MAPRQLKTHNNIIENEEAMIPILAMFSKQFDEYQSQRTEVDDKVVTADAMDKMMKNDQLLAVERNEAYNGGEREGSDETQKTKANIASGTATREFSQLSSAIFAVVNAGDAPFTYVPVKNPEIWADTTEMQAQSSVRATLADWSMKTQDWDSRQLDFYRTSVKYSNMPVRISMYPKMKKIRVKNSRNQIVEKEVNIANYPKVEAIPIYNLYADRNIGTIKDQTFVFVTTKQPLTDITKDKLTSESQWEKVFATPEDVAYSQGTYDIEAKLIANKGETVDDVSATDARRWDVYAKLRLDKSGMISTDMKDKVGLYWFIGYGDDPQGATYTACLSEFDPDNEIPIRMVHTTAGDPNELYHPMFSELIRTHYGMECVVASKQIDAFREVVDGLTVVEPNAFESEPKDLAAYYEKSDGGTIFARNGQGERAVRRITVQDNTQMCQFMATVLEENQMKIASLSPNQLGQGLGGRAPATEVIAVNQFSMQPQFAWVTYYLSQLYGFIGSKMARYWEVYGTKANILAIAGEDLQGRTPGLYGEFDVKVVTGDEYLTSNVEGNQMIQMLQTVASNPALLKSPKHEVRVDLMLVEGFKKVGMKNASRFIVRKDGDAAFRQRTEIETMWLTETMIQPLPEDDHDSHIAEIDAYKLEKRNITDKVATGEPLSFDEQEVADFIANRVDPHREGHVMMSKGVEGGGGGQGLTPEAQPAELTQGQEVGLQESAVLGEALGG